MNEQEIAYLERQIDTGATIVWKRWWANGYDYVRITEVKVNSDGKKYALGYSATTVSLENVALSSFCIETRTPLSMEKT